MEIDKTVDIVVNNPIEKISEFHNEYNIKANNKKIRYLSTLSVAAFGAYKLSFICGICCKVIFSLD